MHPDPGPGPSQRPALRVQLTLPTPPASEFQMAPEGQPYMPGH